MQITAATTDAVFQAADEQMLKAEADYQGFENDLAKQIKHIPDNYSGYHNYHYDVAPIGHDPYCLISILSAVKDDFRLDDPEIQDLLTTAKQPRHQYTLTINKQLSDDYVDQFAGVDIDSIEPKYLDLYIKLTNYDLYSTVDSLLTRQQLARYAGYLRNRGGRPDLFPADEYSHVVPAKQPNRFTVPADRLRQYPTLAAELKVAEPFIGYPYVWSGFEPSTSFDCSGYICYVMDQLGLKYRNVVRGKTVHLPVAGSTVDGVFYDGIYEKCQRIEPADRQPGDLVFFRGSFNVSYRRTPVSHVGIYVGDDMFLACSDPYGVQYQSFDDRHIRSDMSWGDTWGETVVCYGRLPLRAKES